MRDGQNTFSMTFLKVLIAPPPPLYINDMPTLYAAQNEFTHPPTESNYTMLKLGGFIQLTPENCSFKLSQFAAVG